MNSCLSPKGTEIMIKEILVKKISKALQDNITNINTTSEVKIKKKLVKFIND